MGSSDGYFPRGSSVLNRVMRERAVNLLYGQRALVIGALHPVAFIGTTQRSTAHATPWKRLVHTARMFDAVFFGSRAEADKALAFTRRMHERVRGTIGEDVGPYRASTPYDALDPQLMLWVTAPVFDSAHVLYESFVRRLGDDEREQLYQETVTWGELFGMDRSVMPATSSEFATWWPRQLADDGRFATPQARAVAVNIMLRMPGPAHLRPALRTAGFLVQGTLPPVVREKLGLPWSRRDQAVHDGLALAARTGRPLVPGAIRRGSSAQAYDLLRRAERDRLRDGRQSFEAVA